MQTPYNGIFLKSETAALLCNHVLRLVIDVYKPVFLRCGKDTEIMTACMEAVPAQFTEEMYEKYTRQVCNRNRDFKALLCSVIKQMAAERHEKDGFRVVLEGTEDVVGKVFIKRFLIAMAASDSVRSGRFFDPNQTVECAIVTQTNARDSLWSIADEFIRVENPDEGTSDVESEASTVVSNVHAVTNLVVLVEKYLKFQASVITQRNIILRTMVKLTKMNGVMWMTL